MRFFRKKTKFCITKNSKKSWSGPVWVEQTFKVNFLWRFQKSKFCWPKFNTCWPNFIWKKSNQKQHVGIMYNATFQIHLKKTWSVLFKNFHLSFLKDISWWFYIAFGQQVLTFGQQNVDFRNLHEKLIYKVYFFHINQNWDFFEKKQNFA